MFHLFKKQNLLLTSLQKKLSIPTTVSRVLKYIPDLQQQVERLIQKKEELLSRISKQGALIHQEDQIKNSAANSLSSISATRLNDNEVAVHISTYALHKCHLSRILFSLEEDGLRPINASSFESFGGRVFYNLHLQVCFLIIHYRHSYYIKYWVFFIFFPRYHLILISSLC